MEEATAPFQYALSTRAGCECVAHAVQAMTDVDGRAILSIDGIGAFDLVSRGAMLEGLRTLEGGGAALPFVVQFCGSPSTCLWEDEEGVNHEIPQGEGGEQGDSLVQAMFEDRGTGQFASERASPGVLGRHIRRLWPIARQ